MEGEGSSNTTSQSAVYSGLMQLLRPYTGLMLLLLLMTLLSNGMNLFIPQLVARAIDQYHAGHQIHRFWVMGFLFAIAFIFVFTYLQGILQTYLSEKVARDLRNQLAQKISEQSYLYIEKQTPAKLLTHLTSDVDAIKIFISQAVVSILSSVIVVIGAAILLISINGKLALAVLLMIPIISIVFYQMLRRARPLFKKAQEIIDWLNRVITENIIGAALVRVLHAEQTEYNKFFVASGKARSLGIAILRLFAMLIPIISFTSNMAILTVLVLGGHLVIHHHMTLGEFAAFNSYIAMLVFPILLIGFMSNAIARAGASYQRIHQLLTAAIPTSPGILQDKLEGHIAVQQVCLSYGNKPILKNISFTISPHTRTAIIGPTAAGKTQLLYLLAGLIQPDSGKILFDGKMISEWDPTVFYKQIGIVFQDSIIFHMSLWENLAFHPEVTHEDVQLAIETAALKEFIDSLPEGLQTKVSERGNSLSGGQKQRVMLARALALRPRILLLDEFTSRVDWQTEKKIMHNLKLHYPDITLISVTQSIDPIKDYDQIILLMEGELIAVGKHEELLHSCPEYVQIYTSQRSTSQYELQSI
ncbi:MAG: ABC transporter ATP-binding protein/permease [Thermoflavifilum sp.]|nr:ABC transporter ATP-binding protein/permease [Thermoflavifilum sp.]